jgi:Outer membrane lipoprotein-sorting protein
MNKVIALFFLLAMHVLQVSAQHDPKAKAILDEASKKIKSLKTLKAAFAITITGAKSKPQTKKGNVYMKGEKYYVNLSGQEIYCDTKTIWTYSKDNNELQISTFDPSENTFTPSKLFTNFYDKEYTYKYAGEQTMSGKKVEVIHLTPTAKNKQFSKVELMIDKLQKVIAGGKMYEKNGNTYSYIVSKYTANPDLNDNIFVFDPKKYPKVDIVDLR